MKSLFIAPDIEAKIIVLATEDGISLGALIEKLVKAEDRRRHIRVNAILYGVGEKRFRCLRRECPEKNRVPSPLYEEELGG